MRISRTPTPPPSWPAEAPSAPAAVPPSEAAQSAPPSTGEPGTVNELEDALRSKHSDEVVRAVVSALGLQAGAEPISPAAAQQAQRAADTCQTALSGVNALNDILLSAQRDTALFRSCAQETGIDPAALTAQQRSSIDAAFTRHIALASDRGRRGVDLQEAASWMKQAIADANVQQ